MGVSKLSERYSDAASHAQEWARGERVGDSDVADVEPLQVFRVVRALPFTHVEDGPAPVRKLLPVVDDLAFLTARAEISRDETKNWPETNRSATNYVDTQCPVTGPCVPDRCHRRRPCSNRGWDSSDRQ